MKSFIACAAILPLLASPCFAANDTNLPPAVQKTVQSQVGDGKIGFVDKLMEEGEVIYEVEMTKEGKVRDFSVGENGELLNTQVFLPELAASVQKTIQTQLGKGALGDIYKCLDDGDISYDIEMTKEGKTRTFTVSDKGELTDEQVFLNELPSILRKAIRKEAAGSQIGEITKYTEDGELSYDVELTKGSVTRTATFNSDGVLLSLEEPVELSTVPDAAQKKIKSLLGDGKIVALTKVTEDGDVSFDVDILQGGTKKTLSVGADGELLEDEK